MQSKHDLNGNWLGELGHPYYITQQGDIVWWFGEAAPEEPQWANVAHGKIYGDTIELDWVDVPKGINNYSGHIRMLIRDGNTLVKDECASGTYFGLKEMKRQE